MGSYGALGALLLAGVAALYPAPMSWVYVFAVAAFEMWLLRRIASMEKDPVPVGQAPYHFSAEEARLIARYRFYFTYPALARQASNVLAAIGISALVLAPWLTFKLAFFQAAIIGVNLFAVGRLTKLLAPLLALRIAASKGDRDALRMLELHDPAWEKIRAANASGA